MLRIRDLKVAFETRHGAVQAVRGVDLDVAKGEALGIVGESGSGKSVSSYAILRILDQGGRITSGDMTYGGMDLRAASERAMRDIRGREISMIFQNPRAALNPIRKVGRQIEDVLRHHSVASRQDARAKAIAALEDVQIKDPEARYHAYPFELSGGQCQRVVIALALACQPQLLIADEPTTGLDITTQKTVMDLVRHLCRARNMGLILITHDLGLACTYCDRIVVMKDGALVEAGRPDVLFREAEHPYTRRLVASTPRPGVGLHDLLPGQAAHAAPRIDDSPILEVRNLSKTFDSASGPVHAVRDVSFSLLRGASLGLVGESGSGKSTTSAMIARLADPTEGDILLDGASLLDVPAGRFARDPRRASVQMVFQDATDSLNPRQSAEEAIAEPLRRLAGLGRGALGARVRELAAMVDLPEALLTRFPHQLSGGQKARVGIARALAVEPKLLILDEPTAALDVSIQAVVLNLLADLRARLGLSYLFVSHDLAVVQMLCEDVIVMRAGQIEEAGPTVQVMTQPATAYTRALLEAAPRPVPQGAGA